MIIPTEATYPAVWEAARALKEEQNCGCSGPDNVVPGEQPGVWWPCACLADAAWAHAPLREWMIAHGAEWK